MITTKLNQKGMTRRFEPGEIEALLGLDYAEQSSRFETASCARETEARNEKRSAQTENGSENGYPLAA
jgi:hypothetical protein